MKKLAYIDALRGIAVILVIITHCGQFGINNYGYVLTTLINKSEYGVQLFYIASAFTLFLSFHSRINKEISLFRNYFIRRFFRIAPMFYLATVFYLWQKNTWLDSFPDMYYSQIFSHIFFIHSLSPYWINTIVPGGWSVSIEMLFYLIIPFLFYYIKNLNAAMIFFLAALLLQFTLNSYFIYFPLIPEQAVWARYIYCYLPNQLPVFALGLILFHLLNQKNTLLSIKPITILSFFILLILQFWFNIDAIPNFIFISISFIFLAYSLAKFPLSILVNPIINYFGKISYSMYLIHFAILELMIKLEITDIINNNHYTINFILRFFIALTITVIISSLSYYFIEKPFIKLGNKIIGRFGKRI